MPNPDALPTEDMIVYRGAFDGGLALRDEPATDTAPGGATLFGHFTVFDVWYEIRSWLEGEFVERVRPGATTKTIAENRARMTVMFDHGYDPQIGDKPLGPITDLREDDIGAYYEVPLLDTDYNRGFVLPALQGRTIDGRNLGSVLGASFRLRVIRDEWNFEPGPSDHNPDGLPERSILECRVFEFGPVVLGASPAATSGVRGLTDHYFERALRRDPGRSARAGSALAPLLALPGAAPGTPGDGEPVEPRKHSEVTPHPARSAAQIRARLAALRS